MEVELKYNIESKEQMEEIWNDDFLRTIEVPDSRQEIFMKAAYFDTDELLLSGNDIAFRIRFEGSRVVGALKWRESDTAINGLYIRNEINVPVDDEACFIAPRPEIFKESQEGRDLLDLLGDAPLHCMFETRFKRRKFRVELGPAICEVALDAGEILADGGTAPINELEIELYSGKQEDLMKVGQKIADKYGLKPEPLSKYARGLEIVRRDSLVGHQLEFELK